MSGAGLLLFALGAKFGLSIWPIALGIPVILISCLIITRIQETKGADLNAL